MINSLIYGREETPYQYGPHASPRTFGHSGNQSSAGFADPENALVVVVIFNGMAGEAKHQPRMRMTLAAVYEDLGLVPQS
jgi:CubicO group peptidase (beta-lactamase class C family)